jgi:hypothetical protein
MQLPRTAPLLERRHTRRRCVQCGLAAEAISATQVDECPRCGCDLRARPPRSYADMEGLREMEGPAPAALDALARARAEAAAARWLVVVACVALLASGVLLGTLLAAAH